MENRIAASSARKKEESRSSIFNEHPESRTQRGYPNSVRQRVKKTRKPANAATGHARTGPTETTGQQQRHENIFWRQGGEAELNHARATA